MSFEHFFAAIESLGSTRKDQAAALNVSPRLLQMMRDGYVPGWLSRLMKHPELIEALAQDARACKPPLKES